MEYEERSYTVPRCVRYRGKRYRVVAIGERAFARCNNLTSITFNSHITRIDSAAFVGCLSLSKVKFPKKLTFIGDRAFYGCESLVWVDIPSRVEHIGTAAFSQCPSLADITVSDKNNRYTDKEGSSCIVERSSRVLIQGCSNTIIPDDITAISDYAFSGCKELTDLQLPGQIQRIGMQAFAGCENIKSVSIKAYSPPEADESAFPSAIFHKAKFTAPGESVTLYIDAPVWKQFTNY